MIALPFVHLAAFTSDIWSGNPAAVIFPPPEVDAQITDATRAIVSANWGQPITTWVIPRREQPIGTEAKHDGIVTELPAHARGFNIRYFTLTSEIPLCGHATLCAAGVIFGDPARVPPEVKELHFFAETQKIIARRAEEDRVEILLPLGRLTDFAADDAREAKLREVVARAVGEDVKVVHASVGQDHLNSYTVIEIETPDLGELRVDTSTFVRCYSPSPLSTIVSHIKKKKQDRFPIQHKHSDSAQQGPRVRLHLARVCGACRRSGGSCQWYCAHAPRAVLGGEG
jgi:predicted PhzF superfamily epimerase YddE/YHI9